jgi:hypothetical protein
MRAAEQKDDRKYENRCAPVRDRSRDQRSPRCARGCGRANRLQFKIRRRLRGGRISIPSGSRRPELHLPPIALLQKLAQIRLDGRRRRGQNARARNQQGKHSEKPHRMRGSAHHLFDATARMNAARSSQIPRFCSLFAVLTGEKTPQAAGACGKSQIANHKC